MSFSNLAMLYTNELILDLLFFKDEKRDSDPVLSS